MQTITNKKSDVPYGVYTNYESDYNGMYDHMIAFSGESSDPDIACVDIPESDYLVFDASGPQPDSIVNAWTFIWEYFQTSEEKRTYVADFEEYENETDAKIYIGIK